LAPVAAGILTLAPPARGILTQQGGH